MPDRFARVSDEIYRGGEPSADDLRLMRDVYGIKTIVSLDGNIAGKIAPIVKELGMEHIVIPIGGRSSAPLIDYLKNNIASILSSKQPVYVHCRHGSDRTGMACAMYRIQKEGWDADKALNEAKQYGFGDKLDPDTQRLYTNAITGSEDMSAADTEDYAMFDQFQMGATPPAYSPQQSFSAPDDYKFNGPDESLAEPPPAFKDPYAFVSSRPPSASEDRKRQLRRVLLQTMIGEGMPQVGGRDGGSVPIGVGPTETGGMLNL